jgi:hypothetical protein
VNVQPSQLVRSYRAPWGRTLFLTSALVTVVCAVVSVCLYWATTVEHQPALIRVASLLPLVLVLGCIPFTVCGYTITSDSILIHRLLWNTSLPRSGLQSASVEPEVMRGSIRTFGNGGGFSFTGLYYNKSLRSYRAFVTDLRRTVVLRYAYRTVVLSPDAPEEFVRALAVPGSQ